MVLTSKEYDLVTKLAKHSGMDSWFCVQQDKNGDYIYDLEKSKKISLRQGITMLIEGLTEEQFVNEYIDKISDAFILIKLVASLM